ncbi:MAG TPA: hypothetical protein VFB70_08880 [Pyrinomonadaceae bacterium]|nr:hypothetical protein [Pyrinomonadaceae bacterium]
MSKVRFTFNILAVAIFTLAVVSVAQAQATRTWVSGVGDDVNPCSRTAPCKTYAGAISKTAKDGEISTLDPGGFGAVTITKSITINGGNGGQGYGSILAALVNGIIINITDPADVRKSVKLDWLNINGASSGLDGIRWIAGNTLHIENTLIDGFTGDGIDVAFGALSNTAFSMRNVTIRNCVGAGVKMNANSTGTTGFTFNNIQITKCGNAIDAQNGSRGTVTGSTLALSTNGVSATEGASNTEVNLVDTTISSNVTGLNVAGSAVARIARCLITQNVTSLTGTVDTGNNNTIMGNTNNNAPGGAQFPPN